MNRFLCIVIFALGYLFVPTEAKAQNFTVFYVVTAVNANGSESVKSNEAIASVPKQGVHTVGLTWTETDASAVSYNVYRGKVSGGPYAAINTAPVTVLTFTDTFSPPAPPVLAVPTVS